MTAPAAAPAASASPPWRAIRRIVIHCSGSANGKPVTPAELDRWHQLRGFKRNPAHIGFNAPMLKHIGYHYVVETNGVVTACRGEREVGAHVQGSNADSLGVCVVGTDAFTAAQWKALRGLVGGLQSRLTGASVCGHRDLSPDLDGDGIVERHEWLKTCPGFDVAAWLKGGMDPMTGQVYGVAP